MHCKETFSQSVLVLTLTLTGQILLYGACRVVKWKDCRTRRFRWNNALTPSSPVYTSFSLCSPTSWFCSQTIVKLAIIVKVNHVIFITFDPYTGQFAYSKDLRVCMILESLVKITRCGKSLGLHDYCISIVSTHNCYIICSSLLFSDATKQI